MAYLLAIIVLLAAIGALIAGVLAIAMMYDDLREHAYRRRANGAR